MLQTQRFWPPQAASGRCPVPCQDTSVPWPLIWAVEERRHVWDDTHSGDEQTNSSTIWGTSEPALADAQVTLSNGEAGNALLLHSLPGPVTPHAGLPLAPGLCSVTRMVTWAGWCLSGRWPQSQKQMSVCSTRCKTAYPRPCASHPLRSQKPHCLCLTGKPGAWGRGFPSSPLCGLFSVSDLMGVGAGQAHTAAHAEGPGLVQHSTVAVLKFSTSKQRSLVHGPSILFRATEASSCHTSLCLPPARMPAMHLGITW